jgi:outer membrane protein TolC
MQSKSRWMTLCLAAACLCLSPFASSQSWDDLKDSLKDHPSIQELDFRADANRELSVAAQSLPDPVFSLGINNFPIADRSFSEYLPTNKAITVRQEIPNGARREASGRERSARATQLEMVRDARLAQLEGELAALLYSKDRIARQMELAHARAEKYDELLDVVASEIDAGRAIVFRLAEIEAESAEVARTIVELLREEREINAELMDLVGYIPATPSPQIDLANRSPEATEFHAVRIASAGIDVANHAVKGAEAAWGPNWGLQLSYQQRESGATFDGDDWVSAGVTFSVPLWAARSQKPRLRAAQAERSSAEMNHRAVKRNTQARFESEKAVLQAANESIEVLRRKILAVEDEIESQLSLYESGSGDYAPIIYGQLAVLKLQAEIAIEESRAATAIARLNAMVVQP